MSSLQLGLLIVGGALVVAVLLYNFFQERALKRRYADKPSRPGNPSTTSPKSAENSRGPREPSLSSDTTATKVAPKDAPDFMVEAVLTLQLPEAIALTPELAQQMLKTPGKRIRLLWQPQGATSWVRLRDAPSIVSNLGRNTGNDFKVEISSQPQDVEPTPVHSLAFCMQLADRVHVATSEQLDVFQKHVESLASLLSASYTPFDVAVEAERARALDQACAQLDLQIGLTLHGKVGPLSGQQLLQVAQKLGLVLDNGALRYQQDGREIFRIESHDGAPLTEECLRKAIQDPVVLLDVPQVRRPEQSFDGMLQQATKLAQALSAQLVDDRQRPLTEQGLALIRTEVEKAVQAMRDIGIEPGSRRAIRLFAV